LPASSEVDDVTVGSEVEGGFICVGKHVVGHMGEDDPLADQLVAMCDQIRMT
jgi:hypothetical protein